MENLGLFSVSVLLASLGRGLMPGVAPWDVPRSPVQKPVLGEQTLQDKEEFLGKPRWVPVPGGSLPQVRVPVPGGSLPQVRVPVRVRLPVPGEGACPGGGPCPRWVPVPSGSLSQVRVPVLGGCLSQVRVPVPGGSLSQVRVSVPGGYLSPVRVLLPGEGAYPR